MSGIVNPSLSNEFATSILRFGHIFLIKKCFATVYDRHACFIALLQITNLNLFKLGLVIVQLTDYLEDTIQITIK